MVVPNHQGSPFLLDTHTGCVWHIVQNPDTKRSTFIEVDVENLHWSWGSGAQQTLAARIDGSQLTAEQKTALKQELARRLRALESRSQAGAARRRGGPTLTGGTPPPREARQPAGAAVPQRR